MCDPRPGAERFEFGVDAAKIRASGILENEKGANEKGGNETHQT